MLLDDTICFFAETGNFIPHYKHAKKHPLQPIRHLPDRQVRSPSITPLISTYQYISTAQHFASVDWRQLNMQNEAIIVPIWAPLWCHTRFRSPDNLPLYDKRHAPTWLLLLTNTLLSWVFLTASKPQAASGPRDSYSTKSRYRLLETRFLESSHLILRLQTPIRSAHKK